MVGTAAYASHEQQKGMRVTSKVCSRWFGRLVMQSVQIVTQRLHNLGQTDMYSLGVILFELFTNTNNGGRTRLIKDLHRRVLPPSFLVSYPTVVCCSAGVTTGRGGANRHATPEHTGCASDASCISHAIGPPLCRRYAIFAIVYTNVQCMANTTRTASSHCSPLQALDHTRTHTDSHRQSS
jgi:serine/threonine protein kinase